MQFFSAITTLLLVMDPLGNVPAFLACLKDVDERRRMRVVARENLFALLILVFFLFCGPSLLGVLHIGRESLYIAGGVLLFLISLGMIFPAQRHMKSMPNASRTPSRSSCPWPRPCWRARQRSPRS